MTSSTVFLAFLLASATMMASGCSSSTSRTPMKNEIDTTVTITDPSQREAAVDRQVVVIGIQTRTKQPQVNGVDVDGAYELSDTKVVARGVLRKTVVPEEPPSKDGLHAASRGAGTFYAVIDPTTKQIAKTKPAE